MNLSSLILLSLAVGMMFGAVLNINFPEYVEPISQGLLSPIGDAFLRLIQFVVVPIVFSSLVMGLTRIQGAGQVGRYALKLLISYLITGTIALVVGMATAYFLQPGSGLTGFTVAPAMTTNMPTLTTWLISLIPINPLEALSKGNLLQIIFSAILFGIGVQLTPTKAKPFVELMESIYYISEKTLSVILYVAPVGVFGLISSVIASQGVDILTKLFLYVLGLAIASGIMIAIDLLVILTLGREPIKFLQSISESLSLAFGTASSTAALPVILQNMQEKYGLEEEIATFAIPLGTALKRDGAAILQGFNALFVTQVYHIPLTPSLILAIAVSSLLVSFSTPGVPGSAIITMATVLTASGLPLEAIALVAGIDRLTDGFKTVVNVIGNSTNAIILASWESQSTSVATE